MGNPNTAQERAADAKLAAGVTQFFVPGNVTLTVAGVVVTPAQVVAALQNRVSAIDATTTAKAALAKSYADGKTLRTTTQPIVNAVKQIALIMYANAPDTLTVFGLVPRKARAPLTLAEKAERAAKAKATRLARNTMGPKAKAKVKGTVTPAAATASTTAPGASAAAVATAPVVPAAGTNGTAHS